VRVAILGPVELRDAASRDVPAGGVRQRALLARLAPAAGGGRASRSDAGRGADRHAGRVAPVAGAERCRCDPLPRTGGRDLFPAARTSFVGRRDELESVSSLLADHRLVPLVGPGGAGKIRLAVVAPGRFSPRIAEGPVFVELAPVAEGEQVAYAVLDALGRPRTGRGAPALSDGRGRVETSETTVGRGLKKRPRRRNDVRDDDGTTSGTTGEVRMATTYRQRRGQEAPSSLWSALLVLGIAVTVLGVLLIANPFTAASTLAILVGVALLLSGLTETMSASRSSEGPAGALFGVMLLLGGILVLVWPGATLRAVAAVAGAVLIVAGVVRGFLAWREHGSRPGWGIAVPLLLSALAVVVGVMALIWPGATIVVIAVLFGIFLVVTGVTEISLGLALRPGHSHR
jgi:uncharacterized membrane protein HdeD (DUF308 family)